MATGDLADLRTSIQHRGYATDTATAQTALINSVYRRIIGMRRWPFLEVGNNTSITTTVGDNAYALSTISDLLHIDAVRAEFGQEYHELEYKAPQELRVLQHRYRDNGTPMYWSRIGTELHLWPAPDQAYTLNVDYVKDPPDLSADGDLTLLPLAYVDLIVWAAISELCFRERDMDGYNLAKQEYGTRLMDMMNEYGVRQRQNSAQVVESGTYDYLEIDDHRSQWHIV